MISWPYDINMVKEMGILELGELNNLRLEAIMKPSSWCYNFVVNVQNFQNFQLLLFQNVSSMWMKYTEEISNKITTLFWLSSWLIYINIFFEFLCKKCFAGFDSEKVKVFAFPIVMPFCAKTWIPLSAGWQDCQKQSASTFSIPACRLVQYNNCKEWKNFLMSI